MKEMTVYDIRACALDILIWFDSICKQHNLRYWLCGGTLLGAIRHKGFIPWDDDIDVMMPRHDYEVLSGLFPSKGHYELCQPILTKGYALSFSKIADTRTVKIENGLRSSVKRIGVDIDVFPIDNLPENTSECLKYYKKIDAIDLWLNCMISSYTRGKTLASSILRYLGITAARIAEFVHLDSVEHILFRYNELSQKYNAKECAYWGITSIGHYGIKERNHKRGYDNSVTVEFEGHPFPAPAAYDTYLSQLYGHNYMQLPPESMRATHHSFQAFWK